MSFEFAARLLDRRLDVQFGVPDGETVALLGENGAGKSTVLAIAAGHLVPDTGQVSLDGRVLLRVGGANRVDVPPHDREIALLSQDPLLFPHLSVRDNVAFGPRSRGRSRRTALTEADRWLAEVDAAEFAARKPSALSGGEAQRVAVARAMAADPRLLLLDEPMAAVDVSVAPVLRQALRRVLSGRTAVLVTHDPLDALLLADRVVVLDHGQVVEEGPTREVLARPRSAFAADLAGLNLLSGTWSGAHLRLADGTTVTGLVTGPGPEAGGQAVATFRPGSVAVYRDAPAGSPRNSFTTRITALDPLGDLIRVRSKHLSAHITTQAAADLDLVPGMQVSFSVKATEVSVYRL
ncbi:MAG: transporter related protein [Marmoricola sp.]|nr:transporter related protein [Marmoricola sp.]